MHSAFIHQYFVKHWAKTHCDSNSDKAEKVRG